MKLTLLNVKYSQNLGDGIIAECLEHALKASPDVSEVRSCDLAGRKRFDGRSNRLRQVTRSLLDRLPHSLRRTLSIAILKQMVSSKLRAHYARELRDTDIAIIGGGQLIADAELNFPLKLYEATQAARDAHAEIAIYGVGVGHSFSRRGFGLFRAAFEQGLTNVQLRDERSAKRWQERFGGNRAGQVWDPGLLSRQVYGRPYRPQQLRKRMGIGITHPSTLDLHADRKTERMSRSDWVSFYRSLIAYFIARGWTVELFTNGAWSDHIFARKVLKAALADAADASVTLAEHPRTPKALAHQIASYDTIVAHRLHASVVAYAYGIPHVGLGWDSKMEGFFEATGRERFLISAPCLLTINHIGQTALDAAATPIPYHDIADIEEAVQREVSAFSSVLSKHLQDQPEKTVMRPRQHASGHGLTEVKVS